MEIICTENTDSTWKAYGTTVWREQTDCDFRIADCDNHAIAKMVSDIPKLHKQLKDTKVSIQKAIDTLPDYSGRLSDGQICDVSWVKNFLESTLRKLNDE